MSNTPLCICTTAFLSIHLLRDISVAFMSWLLSTVLRWTLGYVSLSILVLYISSDWWDLFLTVACYEWKWCDFISSTGVHGLYWSPDRQTRRQACQMNLKEKHFLGRFCLILFCSHQSVSYHCQMSILANNS